jgi:hypothetical protein
MNSLVTGGLISRNRFEQYSKEDGEMTLKLKKFGTVLVTRYDAKSIVKSFGQSSNLPTLDFSGVDVVNHSFADELGKGLMAIFAVSDFSKVLILNANSYVYNCLMAGFSTAIEGPKKFTV